MVQRNDQAITYTYDNAGNITQETFADGSHDDYTYDSYGELLTATDSSGATSFTYDALGDLTSVSYPNGQSLNYSYDSKAFSSRSSIKADTQSITSTIPWAVPGRCWMGRAIRSRHTAMTP